MSFNLEWSDSIVEKLKAQGVRLFCICPGARNAALVESLSRHQDLEVRTFVDERSAGFFALGRSLEFGKPAAVCTTSGTAVAELLSATIEAHHVNAPLVLLTADRPPRFRGRGAPQAIDQLCFMKDHLTLQWDLVNGDTNFNLSPHGPTQINVCFEEPVLGSPPSVPEKAPSPRVGDRPLVIVGQLNPQDRALVQGFLNSRSGYFLAEAHSGLRGCGVATGMKELPHHLLTVDRFKNCFDSVIRVGGVPTLRLWRDLEDALSSIPVLSFSPVKFSGLGRESTLPGDLISLKDLNWSEVQPLPELDQAMGDWQRLRKNIKSDLPKSELAMISQLSELLPAKSKVFLGNSLPVREWDLVADSRRDLDVRTQRGVNGIDGLISTFFGRLDPAVENVLVIGDLSAVYDSNAFWVWKQALQTPSELSAKIVVVNNGGGRIFRRLFESTIHQSPHEFEFSDFSQLFGWEYFRWTHSSQMNWQGLPAHCLVELQPHLEDSDRAWDLLRG